MKNEHFSVKDGSNDRRYYTMIPNYVLNHSTLWDREVYLQMKRIAGEDGTCWASQNTLAKQCGMSINRLKKSLKYLLDNNWLQLVGKKHAITGGGIQEINEYSISDLWRKNLEFYEKKGVSQGDTPGTKGVSPGATPGYHQEATNKNQYNKNHIEGAETSSALIPEVIKMFEEVNPACKRYYGNITQRKACQDLIDIYGFEEISKVIEFLPVNNSTPYKPRAHTPLQLWERYQSIKDSWKQEQNTINNKTRGIII